MTDRPLSALYCVVTEWAIARGALNLAATPGLWHARTEKIGDIGPFDVRINAHKETIDAIPPYYISIGMDEMFPGIVAVINPFEGTMMHSQVPGEDEDGLIAHFKAQIKP